MMVNRAFLAILVLITASTVILHSGTSSGNLIVAVVDFRDAMTRTQEGQERAKELREKYAAREKQLKAQQAELEALRDQMRKGQNLMSAEFRSDLALQINRKTRALERAVEDARAELRQEEAQIANEMGERMLAVIADYSQNEGPSLVLNLSRQEGSVLYANESIDITSEIVRMYDQTHPAAAHASGPK